MSTNQAPRAPQSRTIDIAPIDTTPKALALVPSTLDGAMQLARWLAMSSFMPDYLRGKEGDIFAILLAGTELGLPPMATLRGLYIVNGKPALEAKTKAAICLERGAALYFRKVEDTPKAVTWETMRKGDTEARRSRFTLDEAERAGLTSKSGPWKLYPQRMLGHRALGWLCDDTYPDIVLGVSTAEDFDPKDYTFSPIPGAGGIEVGTPRALDSVPAATSAPAQTASVPANVPSSTAEPKPAADAKAEPVAMSNADVEEIVGLMHEAKESNDLAEIARVHINGSAKTMTKEQRDYLARVYGTRSKELRNGGGQ